MTRQAAPAAGAEAARVPLLAEHEYERNGRAAARDRRSRARGRLQLADHPRRHPRSPTSSRTRAGRAAWYATGRRGVSSLTFRGYELCGRYTGFTDRPAYADARAIAGELIEAYTSGRVDRVEMLYNSYVSPLTQARYARALLPLSHATIAGEQRDASCEEAQAAGQAPAGARRVRARPRKDPQAADARLRRDLDLPRAGRVHRGFFGAQMTAMRSASENAGEIIAD